MGEKTKCSVCRCEREGLDKKGCRNHIDYPDDNDCVLVAVDKHEALTLREIGDRMNLSWVRIKQIESKAIKKIQQRLESRQHGIQDYEDY